MRNYQNKNTQKIRRMVILALFTALAYVTMLVVHITIGGFLTLDVKDAVITLCGLYFGPLAALVVSVLVPILELFTVSSTGAYGLIMNISGTVSFAVTAALIYRNKKTFKGAILGLVSGSVFMVLLMLLLNLLITPYYFGMPRGEVSKMIPTLLLPFNLVKVGLNTGLVLLFYKPLSTALKKAGFLHSGKRATSESTTEVPAKPQSKRSLFVTLTALLLVALSLIVIFVVLEGKFGFGI